MVQRSIEEILQSLTQNIAVVGSLYFIESESEEAADHLHLNLFVAE